ncbi:amidase domain-containing protein [Clostridium sp.]|uniref:amidase domain-containing protein n=1 Tax=Clostridium sp. TaxID=1506 RepID=UPI0032163B9D
MKSRNILKIIKKAIAKSQLKDKITSRSNYVYNRTLAKAYAEAYAESPNLKEYPLFKENDCTNFISQVLVAGGMKMEGTDYRKVTDWFCYTKDAMALRKVSLTWRGSQYFRMYWGNKNGEGNNMANEYRELTVEEAIAKFDELYKYLMIGDVIQYADSNQNVYHSQVIHSKEFNVSLNMYDIFIAQHSVNRKHVSLYQYLKLLRNKKARYVYIYHF